MVKRYLVGFVSLWVISILSGWAWRSSLQTQNANCQLRVLTYASFSGEWGPGPKISELFEKQSGCQIEWLNSSSSGTLGQSAALFHPDVVVGLDDVQLYESKDLWQKAQEFDWSAIAWVYRQDDGENLESFEDLLAPKWQKKFVLPDPRFSTPAFLFVLFVLDHYGWDSGWILLKKMKDQAFLIGSSWKVSYGIFKKGNASFALSYITSPLYHWLEENDFRYQAVSFSAGLPVQSEFIAIPKNAANQNLANQFMIFLQTPELQNLFLQKNFMFPVKVETVTDARILKLMEFKKYIWKDRDSLIDKKQEIFEKWQNL